MNKITKIAIVIVLILVVGAVIAVKENNKANSEPKAAENPVENISAVKTPILGTEKAKEFETLPRLVDLGADKCIPCKMMAPVLEELKKDYAGTLSVEFIDVWKNPDKAKEYEIMIIPTQIFFDASGKELFRHEGFFSKEDILAKWKQLGVNIERRRE
jgi:thioredoxin 1